MRKYDYGKLNQREKNRLARLAEYYASVKGCSFEEQLESMIIQPGDEESELLIPRDEMTVDNPVLKAVASIADDLAARMDGNRTYYQNVLLGYDGRPSKDPDKPKGDLFTEELYRRCNEKLDVIEEMPDLHRSATLAHQVSVIGPLARRPVAEWRTYNGPLNDPGHGAHESVVALYRLVEEFLGDD